MINGASHQSIEPWALILATRERERNFRVSHLSIVVRSILRWRYPISWGRTRAREKKRIIIIVIRLVEEKWRKARERTRERLKVNK